VERTLRHVAPGGTSRDGPVDGEPAIRDAAEIVARAAADEAAADRARERYRTSPMVPITPDARIAAALGPGELVVAVRPSAVLERREPQPDEARPRGLAGALYVTSRRLILLGRVSLAIAFEEIEEVGLSGERLLLVLCDRKGVWLEAPQPRLLRVEIAWARAAVRG
jgi:hypothetical protein